MTATFCGDRGQSERDKFDERPRRRLTFQTGRSQPHRVLLVQPSHPSRFCGLIAGSVRRGSHLREQIKRGEALRRRVTRPRQTADSAKHKITSSSNDKKKTKLLRNLKTRAAELQTLMFAVQEEKKSVGFL